MRLSRLLFTTILYSFTCIGQWSHNPENPLKIVDQGMQYDVCSDGRGGAYVAFHNFSYERTRYYLQHLDKDGVLTWSNPLMLSDLGNLQWGAHLIEDGEGGTIVAFVAEYLDHIIETKHYYKGNVILQRVNKFGEKLWGLNGVRASMDTAWQEYPRDPKIVTDMNNGAIVILREHMDVYPNVKYPLIAQRIRADGSRAWSDTGLVLLDTTNFNQSHNIAVSDGKCGIYILYSPIWLHQSLAQIDSGGMLRIISDSLVNVYAIAREGKDGLFLGGFMPFDSLYNFDIVVSHLTTNGVVQWKRIISSNSDDHSDAFEPLVFSDSVFAIVNLASDTSYFQMVDRAGRVLIPPPGLQVVHDSSYDHRIWKFIESDSGSLLISATGFSPNHLPVNACQKINATGQLFWGKYGIVFSTWQYYSGRDVMQFDKAVSDCNGGAIFFGSDEPWDGIFAQLVNKNGEIGSPLTAVAGEDMPNLPSGFDLSQNYPNPFNPNTTISYNLPNACSVELVVYDVLGREISVLVNAEQSAGVHKVKWNVSQASSGVYFYRLHAAEYNAIKKMQLIK